jgi:hypothetical protein
MPDKPPLDSRSDEQIMDDIIACLAIVQPQWFDWFDDSARVLHVREQLDDLERQARETGFSETGCMVVEYDAENKKIQWSIRVAYRYEDGDE